MTHNFPGAATNDYRSMLNKDIFGYLPVKILPAISGLAIILLLTRKLAPVQYGEYSLVITTVLLMAQLSGTWLSNAVLYIFPDYPARHYGAFQIQTLKLQAIAAIPASILVYFLLVFITSRPTLAVLGAILLPLQLFQFLMMTFMQSQRRVTAQAVSIGAQSLVQVLILCVLLFGAEGKEISAILAIALGYVISILILVGQNKLYQYRRLNAHDLQAKELFRQLAGYGIPMCLWFFATQCFMIGDRVILKLLGVTAQLGQYASFRDLGTGCAGLLTMPLLMASHPIIMAMWKNGCDREPIEDLVKRNIVVLTFLFIPLLVFVDLCGSELFVKLLPEKYLLPKETMLLVLGSIFLGCLNIYLQKGLEVTGQTLLMAKIALVTVAFSLVGNFILIPRLAIFGAALVGFLSQLFYMIAIRKYTAHILSPDLPLNLLPKLGCWVLGIEIVCRLIPSLPGIPEAFISSPYFRFAVILISTGGLYAVNEEISLFVHEFYRSLKSITTLNS